MVEVTSVFAVGAIGMFVGTVAFLRGSMTAPSSRRRFYAVLATISGIAAVAYGMMALGYGGLSIDGRVVFVPRYVDWVLTTPLIVLFLGMLADVDRRGYAVAILLNTVVMVVGFVAATLPGVERFALFGLASIAYVGLVYYLLKPMSVSAAARPRGFESLFVRLRNLTVILWSVYPVIWLLGPPGLDLLTPTLDVALITYLDLVTKVGFGLIALDASATLEAELGDSFADDTDTNAAASAD